MRILVDRFIYQGLRHVPRRHAVLIRTYAPRPQDQMKSALCETKTYTVRQSRVMRRRVRIIICSMATENGGKPAALGVRGACRPVSTAPRTAARTAERSGHDRRYSFQRHPEPCFPVTCCFEGVATGSGRSAALSDMDNAERIAAVDMLKECLEVSVVEQLKRHGVFHAACLDYADKRPSLGSWARR